MTRNEAKLIIELVHIRTDVSVEQGLQLATDTYVQSLLKEDSSITYHKSTQKFDRRIGNFSRAFQQAFRTSLKKMQSQLTVKHEKVTEQSTEEKFILSDVCKQLKMTPQNLNYLLRTYPDIKVIEFSSRKRYLTKSEINKLKNVRKKSL